MRSYFRLDDSSSDPERLLHPDAQVSEPWDGGRIGPCDKCDGTGRTRHECESCKAQAEHDCPSCAGAVSYERECPACEGTGRIVDPARRGVSVFPDEEGLYRYMLKREAVMEDKLLVELEGEPARDEDIDADEGALLVHPRRIVDSRPVDRDRVGRLRAQLAER